ncbi:hypothetical protein FRB96_001294 [Tulasnella sp. 330]|nr:hypothetical protein FRB96_001294 [Tulasnella sp. 330]KAG8873583.1 hypothetical protein FRB97_006636 [Tulasnella sp. 331]KAG8877630.1 hypothetical protein FRB98_006611 [Tulasnella sp. 332]
MAVLVLAYSAAVVGQTTVTTTTVFVNDPQLIYSGLGDNPGISWGDPGLNPNTYNNITCNGGVKATKVQGASVTLMFTGTAVTVNFLLDQLGSTAQVLLDGSLIHEVNTITTAGSSYFACNFAPVTSDALSNISHNLTAVKDVATGYMYMHSFVFTPAPVISTSSTAASASTSGSSNNPSSSHHSSHGAAAGGAIGAVVILLIAGIIAFLFRRRSRQGRVAHRNSFGIDGSIHSPDLIVPMSVPWNQSQRKSVNVAVKDNLATPTLDGPLHSPLHGPSVSIGTPSSRSPAEVVEMSSFNHESQAPVGVARQELGKFQTGRQDSDISGLPPITAAPTLSLPASSSIPTSRPLPPPPASTSHISSLTPSASVTGPNPQPHAASSGQIEPALSPQLEFIQSLVNRGLDNSTISNVINMMATSTPLNATAARPEGGAQDDTPPAYM